MELVNEKQLKLQINTAAKCGEVDSLINFYKYLCTKIPNIGKFFSEILWLGVANNHIQVVKFAISFTFYSNRCLIRSVVKAAKCSYAEIAQFLVDFYGFDKFPKEILPRYFAKACEFSKIIDRELKLRESSLYRISPYCSCNKYLDGFYYYEQGELARHYVRTWPTEKIIFACENCDGFKNHMNVQKAFQAAIQQKNLPLIQYFVENLKYDVHKDGSYCLHVALDCNFEKGFEYLVGHCKFYPNIIFKALNSGLVEKIKFVGKFLTKSMKKHVETSYYYYTILRKDDIEIMRYFVDIEIDFDYHLLEIFAYKKYDKLFNYYFSILTKREKINYLQDKFYPYGGITYNERIAQQNARNILSRDSLKMKNLQKNIFLKFILKPASLHTQLMLIE
jgi:hypothetical protein